MCSLRFSLSLICHTVSPFPLFLSFALYPLSPLPPPRQEASSRLAARLTAAGNAAVCVALAAQKGKERESGEGEERQRADAQEEQSQEDEVNKLTPGWGGNQ